MSRYLTKIARIQSSTRRTVQSLLMRVQNRITLQQQAMSTLQLPRDL